MSRTAAAQKGGRVEAPNAKEYIKAMAVCGVGTLKSNTKERPKCHARNVSYRHNSPCPHEELNYA